MNEKSARKPHVIAWALSIVAVLVIYVGSIGPVRYLQHKRILPVPIPHWADVFYMPVSWLGSETPLKGLFNAYVMWWVQLAIGPADPFSAPGSSLP